ncbi:MAG: NAD(P)/FAD-dependent oxidoreductase [Deltaproteobacteria bacterium]|nr:NAD(P)/FAD-dependent oxidoreductase [Deltaproteobacteria bacterium]MCW8893349.1 NAD(P)/FAD-dependent oxidoreductase [Deltaproteobacteria bacterium]
MKRRDFIKYGAVGLGAVSLCAPNVFAAGHNRRRVVVVGGGYGGATAARYIKLIDSSVEVILIEKNDQFISCPISNWVLVGMKRMSDISFGYQGLAARGIQVIKDEIIGIDAKAGYVQGRKGKVEYDRLIVSPGIDFRYDLIEGFDDAARKMFPHAYKAGPQTVQLQQELQALQPGGTVLMTVPDNAYRCPPGPYERASLIADYLQKNKKGSKLVILDPHQKIASKGKLFKAAWDAYYTDIIDYRTEEIIASVDAKKKTISTYEEEFKADVINFIPDQKAGKLAFDLGLIPEKKLWAPVKPLTLESTLVPGVHVIGDATDSLSSGPMPKSGFVANSMGKVAAAAVVAELSGKKAPLPSFANTCYSMVSGTEAIFITGVYKYDLAAGKNIKIKEASITSPGRSAYYGKCADDWATSIWSDMLS